MSAPLLQTSFSYQIRRTRRRSLGIYVFPDGRVEVRAPKNARKQDIFQFVEAQSDWVARQLEQYGGQPPISQAWIDGAMLRFLGQDLSLSLQTGASSAQLQGRELQLSCYDPDDSSMVQAGVRNWYRQQAHYYLPLAVSALFRRHAEQLQQAWQSKSQSMAASRSGNRGCSGGGDRRLLTEPGLKIRAMRSRWGSCSAAGNLNLNLWLMQLPPPLVEYVIIHELCHLVEFNHSAAFYALMDTLIADRDTLERELKTFATTAA